MNGSLLTCFASAERSSQSEIMRQYQIISTNKDLVVFLNSIASMVSVLNTNRQIVFVNKLIMNMVGASDINQVLGQRVGELFGCEHAFEVNGCGTSSYCSACGAVRTMLACLSDLESVDECSLTNSKATFDLRVHSTYTRVGGEDFIICSLFDISDEKRRGVMEHIFFHDILNTVNGISGITQVLNRVKPVDQPLFITHLNQMVNSLTEEIGAHRVLTLAEKGEYTSKKDTVQSLEMITLEVAKYQQVAIAGSKKILIDESSENCTVETDRVLLSRVLCNMIKNALEAEPAGAAVKVGTHRVGEQVSFYVHNNSVISPKNQLQVFQRSFSTKGQNRGLGTYSMKLLTDHYLNGKISFTSLPDKGTTFVVTLPISMDKEL